MTDWKIKIRNMNHLSALILVIFTMNAAAQTSYDSSFHFYYYDQKLSMFEVMPDQKDEIVWLGDSITDGGEWSELFPHYRTLNRGVSTDNTFGILNRIGEITRRKPKKLFLLIGINDIARGIPNDVILKNFKRIIDSVRLNSPRTKIYVQSILPTNDAFSDFKNYQHKENHIAAINTALQKMEDGNRIIYVDLNSALADAQGKLDRRYTNDGLHLLGEGYTKWKEILIEKNYL